MSNSMIIWYGMVIAVLLVFAFQFFRYLMAGRRHNKNHHKVISQSRERDMFYVPGDARNEDEEDGFDEF